MSSTESNIKLTNVVPVQQKVKTSLAEQESQRSNVAAEAPAKQEVYSQQSLKQQANGEQDGSDSLEKQISDFTQHVQSIRRELNFQVSKEDGDVVIEVYDSDSQRLIRKIPSTDIQDLIASRNQESSSALLNLRV